MRVIFVIFLSASASLAYTFKEAAQKIKFHPRIKALIHEAEKNRSEGRAQSSWGDPKLGVTAKNFPKDSLARDKSPMTGVDFSISQNFPLSPKYSYIEESYERLAESKKLEAENRRRTLLNLLWNLAIAKRNLVNDAAILKENLGWIKDMLKVSQRLYANGKLSQQALLELQIRQSELEAQISNKKHALLEVEAELVYLNPEKLDSGKLDPGKLDSGKKEQLDWKSAPWKILRFSYGKEDGANEVEKALKAKARAFESMLAAKKWNYVPDVALSAAYTERDESLDDHGDFVSAGISFTLPLSSSKYAQADSALASKLKAQNELKNYHLKKRGELGKLRAQIEKIKEELSIIRKKSLLFAKSSRDIVSKSYGLGNADYIELLQAEIKYQRLLLKKNELQARLDSKKVAYLYLRGDPLHEK